MEGLDFLNSSKNWHLFGLKHSFFNIDSKIVTDTWIVLLILLVILVPCYIILTRKTGLIHFVVADAANYFVGMTKQALGHFEFKHCAFIASIFIFIATCNLLCLIPGLEEPTSNPNTTLAVGIIQFLYIQYYTIRAHGLWGYTKEYFSPIFIMFPLHVVSKLASIVSISFRLFGNIFGGLIISSIYFGAIGGSWWKESLGIFSGLNLSVKLFFGIFEGFLQAFVFTMLSSTYLGMAIQTEHDKPEQESDQDKKSVINQETKIC